MMSRTMTKAFVTGKSEQPIAWIIFLISLSLKR
jgi:hypothetical protein